jgi:toxin YoeB
MRVLWSHNAWTTYAGLRQGEPPLLAKINELIENIRRDPFHGLGKPEPLKGAWQGWWSRRISNEHRLVYRVHGKGELQTVEIAQCVGHY